MRNRLIFQLAVICLASSISYALAEDGITIVSGEHYEFVCRDDGLVDVHQTILVTANKTETIKVNVTYQINGVIVGDHSFEIDPEISECDVKHTPKNKTTDLFVYFKANLTPHDFVNFKLHYTMEGLLKKEEKGNWRFKNVFIANSTTAIEIVLKIPKPKQFYKILIEDAIPTPQVFIEESQYYVLVWNIPHFTSGGAHSIYIDISYRTELDINSVIVTGALLITGAILGFLIEHGYKKLLYMIRTGTNKIINRLERIKPKVRMTRWGVLNDKRR